MKPSVDQVPDWYQGYIKVLPEMPLIDLLEYSGKLFVDLLGKLTEEKALYRYAPDKWSIKDLILHICDAERIFLYRALRFSRADQTVLSGFDHNAYVEVANADSRSLLSLIEEFQIVRNGSIHCFRHNEEVKDKIGLVDDNSFSVDVLGYIIAGHQMHHQGMIKEKYLPAIV